MSQVPGVDTDLGPHKPVPLASPQGPIREQGCLSVLTSQAFLTHPSAQPPGQAMVMSLRTSCASTLLVSQNESVKEKQKHRSGLHGVYSQLG